MVGGGHYSSHSLGHYLRQGPGPLVRYGTGVNHYQMWLNIVIKFVKIPYLLTRKKVEDSLSTLLCMS